MALLKVITTLRESESAHNNILYSNMNATTATTSASPSNHHQAYRSDKNTSRPRSGAIAIKTHKNCSHKDDLASNKRCNERMYNIATWRMYNRILDHRRNQCVNNPTRLPMSDTEQQVCRYIDSKGQNLETTISPESSLDGAVFELDIWCMHSFIGCNERTTLNMIYPLSW